MKEVLKKYPHDVQVAYKHFPLRIHGDARLAAIAGEAARQQGKFWQMHDLMFSRQRSLDRQHLLKLAETLDLDLDEFDAALDSAALAKRVDNHLDEGTRLGVRGTPSFFINGKLIVGTKSLAEMTLLIEEELAKARAVLAEGIPRKRVYARIVENGVIEGAVARERARPLRPASGQVHRIEVGDSPTKGDRDALVTIVQFSDLQCPYSATAEATIDRISKEYPGLVRVVWKDLPLPMHSKAIPAALAARAAGDQGKFWEMQRLLFKNQKDLSAKVFADLAHRLRLDLDRFSEAADGQVFKSRIEADAALARQLGVPGTPAFFINGQFHFGDSSYESFKARIDAALADARKLVAKGTPRARVYETIMRSASGPASGVSRGG
jgi:protein-disulfide isomerase